MNIQQVKQRFGIIGNDPLLNRAIEISLQVAPTDISVLVQGESGTGKEVMPQIIHHYSHRKHHQYIAVNCGAIPEGTIDSELFGHEKGAFTGATDSRKGYFEVANEGTIFLDEVAELPLKTQVRLLRVLETGEYIRVGSSKIQKTNVRIVAASHKDLKKEIAKGNFREDLFYRLSSVPIYLPPLRKRKEDIHLLFRKFAYDFSEKYRMPQIKLTPEAVNVINNYPWPGNIRQLRNIVEQISVIEEQREIDVPILMKYLPHEQNDYLPMIVDNQNDTSSNNQDNSSNNDLLYKMILELKADVTDVKRLLFEILQGSNTPSNFSSTITPSPPTSHTSNNTLNLPHHSEEESIPAYQNIDSFDYSEEVEESLSIEETEKELIRKALKKHRGKRKHAAKELGISERTLYRKIKEYNLN